MRRTLLLGIVDVDVRSRNRSHFNRYFQFLGSLFPAFWVKIWKLKFSSKGRSGGSDAPICRADLSPKKIPQFARNMTITLGRKATTTTLSGSVQTVVEYLEFSVHSLLYQRGLYPSDDFQIVRKYNLSLLLSNDDKVKEYIATIMKQLHRMFSPMYLCTLTRLLPVSEMSYSFIACV